MTHHRWTSPPLTLAIVSLVGACGPGVLAQRAETLRARTCACGDEACFRQVAAEGRALGRETAAARVSEADRAVIARAADASRRCLIEGYWWQRARALADRACACGTMACVKQFQERRRTLADAVGPLGLSAAERQPITGSMKRAQHCVAGEIWAKVAEQIRRRGCGCQGPLCFPSFMDDLKQFQADAGKVAVTRAIADRIRKSTEAGMRCVLKQHRRSPPAP